MQQLCRLSQKRLNEVRETLGEDILLDRLELVNLKEKLLKHNVTILSGVSGSGKSSLCKIGVQRYLHKSFDCLFLKASDVSHFMESPEAIANRGLRRIDELLVSQINSKPVLITIDDLTDAGDDDFDAVLTLIRSALANDNNADAHFILTIHLEYKLRTYEKIAERLGKDLCLADIELPQLPFTAIENTESLPDSVRKLARRHHEFGPALNMKLIDWLVRRETPNDTVDTSIFKSDIDLLKWFWTQQVNNGKHLSAESQALRTIARDLADRFTPDIPVDNDSAISTETLLALERKDYIHLTNERISLTHRFIGDCTRFYCLRTQYREIESQSLVKQLKNPFWVQPIRWLALELAIEPKLRETWQALAREALDNENLYLIDVLLDGAILGKKLQSVLTGFSRVSLPFVIERLINRLLTTAVESYNSFHNTSQVASVRAQHNSKDKRVGGTKLELWKSAWGWILDQEPELVITNSYIIFEAAEAWLWTSSCEDNLPLKIKVSNYILGLAKKVLLVEPESAPTVRNSCSLKDYEDNIFACIVFSLEISPQDSSWLLKVLAGREVVQSNRLEPQDIATDNLLKLIRGNGVLQQPHPDGPKGRVNKQFRKFMLSRNGLYLNDVIHSDFQLGVELFLSLTIQSPRYVYEQERRNRDLLDNDLGTAGSDEIDVCTFNFLPLLSLLKIDEKIAIDLVETICKIATDHDVEILRNLDQKTNTHDSIDSCSDNEIDEFISSIKSYTYELPIIIEDDIKVFHGERKALYWHRNYKNRILGCLLMTIEGWLYSRPSKDALGKTISLGSIGVSRS